MSYFNKILYNKIYLLYILTVLWCILLDKVIVKRVSVHVEPEGSTL